MGARSTSKAAGSVSGSPASAAACTPTEIPNASLNSAQFEGRNALGQRTADFSIQDQLLGIHAAKPLLIGSNLQPVTLGASVKYLRSQIAGLRADAFLLDLGLRYALGNLPLSFGLGVLHLGSGVKFVDQESRLPTRVNFGAAYQLAGPMTLVGSVDEHIHERRRDYTIGLQYQAGGIMTLRGRYNLTQGGLRQEGGGFLNFAGGFGVNFWGGSSLDYAFQPLAQDLEGSGIHRFSFTMRFGRNLPLDLARKRRLEPLPYDLRDALRDQKPGEQAKDGEQGKQKEGNWKGKSKDTGTGDVWKIVNDLEKESRKKSKGKKAKKEDADSEKNRNSEEESDETAPEAIVIW